jgi:hypothetical protein
MNEKDERVRSGEELGEEGRKREQEGEEER